MYMGGAGQGDWHGCDTCYDWWASHPSAKGEGHRGVRGRGDKVPYCRTACYFKTDEGKGRR